MPKRLPWKLLVEANDRLSQQYQELEEKNRQLHDELAELRHTEQEREAARQQAMMEQNRLEAVMEALPVGVAILDSRGGGMQSNSMFERVWGSPRPIPHQIGDYSAYKAWWVDSGLPVKPEEWASARAVRGGETVVGQVMRIERFDGSPAFVLNSAAPVRDAHGQLVGCAVAIQDITEQKEKENELSRLNRTLLALGKSSQAMLRAFDETVYLQEVCRIVVEDCGHAMVWIGFREQDEARSVRPVASAGFEAGYLDTLHITWADTERGQGPTGVAIRTGKPVMCRDMRSDPCFEPWREEALKRGYAASIALPLLANGSAIGALAIYSREPDPFTEEEVKLLVELANDLAYGIATLRLRNAHSRVEGELQAAYDALRQSEERYRSLFTGMTEGFALHEIILDERGVPCDYRFLDVNPAFGQLTGLKRADVIGKAKNEVPQLRDDDPRWTEIYGRVALTGEPVHFDNYSPPLRRHYDVFAYCPKPGQFAVIFMDITERKHMEESLRVNLAKYSTLFDSFPIGVSISGPDGQLLEANAEAERLLGISRDEHLQRQIDGAEWQIIRPDGTPMPPEEYASVRALNENRAIDRVEMGILKPGQPATWISVSATPIPIEGYGVMIVYWDVTERRNSEKALRENAAHLERLNRELQDFAFIASHDLKEPLRKIRSFGERVVATASPMLEAEQQDFLQRMMKAADRMQVMIDGLLSYSRVTTQAQPHSLVDLSQVAEEVLSDLEMQVEQSNSKVDIAPLPGLEADPLQMHQLLQNLIGNALKFTRPGVPHQVKVYGNIDRRPDLPEPVVVIRVEDNGIGFEMKELHQLFQPFHRLVSRSEYEGSGIGLAVCRKIVERHKGSITAESVPGKGSTFIVTLPVKQG